MLYFKNVNVIYQYVMTQQNSYLFFTFVESFINLSIMNSYQNVDGPIKIYHISMLKKDNTNFYFYLFVPINFANKENYKDSVMHVHGN